MPKRTRMDTVTQFAIPGLMAIGYLLTSMKYPQWGVVVNLAAQPFWFYSSYKAYKEAGQIGQLITTVILTILLAIGVINYWLI